MGRRRRARCRPTRGASRRRLAAPRHTTGPDATARRALPQRTCCAQRTGRDRRHRCDQRVVVRRNPVVGPGPPGRDRLARADRRRVAPVGQGRGQPPAGALPEPQCGRACRAGGAVRRRGGSAAVTATASARPALDLLDGASYVDGAYDRYDWFREHEPVAWDDINELWGVFRYADVEHIETHDEIFI